MGGRIMINIIVQNHEGPMLTAQSTTKNCLVEFVVAEALRTFYAVKFSKEMSFSDIILEGDAL